MSLQKHSRVVYFSALYDLVVTAAFATPWSARWLGETLSSLHQAWSLAGSTPGLHDPFALLFANLMGSIVVIWAIIRLRSPTLEFGAYDTLGRLLFSAWMCVALVNGASSMLMHFLIPEALWAVVQGSAVYLGYGAQKQNAQQQVALTCAKGGS